MDGLKEIVPEPDMSVPRAQLSKPLPASTEVEEQIFSLAERCALPYITRRTAQTRAKFGVEANENRVIRDTIGRLMKGLAGVEDLMLQLTYIVRATTKDDARVMALVVPRSVEYKRLLAQALIQCLALHEQLDDARPR